MAASASSTSLSRNILDYEPKVLNITELGNLHALIKSGNFHTLASELQNLGYTPTVVDELSSNSDFRTYTLTLLGIKLDGIRRKHIAQIAKDSRRIVEYMFANKDISLTERIRFSLQPEVVRELAKIFRLKDTDDLAVLNTYYSRTYYTRGSNISPSERLAGATKYEIWDEYHRAIKDGARNLFQGIINAASNNNMEMLKELISLEKNTTGRAYYYTEDKIGTSVSFYNKVAIEIEADVSPGDLISEIRLSGSGYNRPLAEAVKNDATEAIDFLLGLGADPAVLIFAATTGNLPLFERGVRAQLGLVNSRFECQKIAVFAARYGHMNIIEYILIILKRFIGDRASISDFKFIVSEASRGGHLEALKYILKFVEQNFTLPNHPLEIQELWRIYLTILKNACEHDHAEMAAFILGDDYIESSKFRFRGHRSKYPHRLDDMMLWCVSGRSPDCLLIAFDALKDVKVNMDYLLDLALKYEKFSGGVVFLLFERVAKISHEMINRAARLCADKSDYIILDYLIQRGTSLLNYIAKVAARQGRVDIISRVLDAGANNYRKIVTTLVEAGRITNLRELVNGGRILAGSVKVNVLARSYDNYTNEKIKEDRVLLALWLISHGLQDCGGAAIWAMKNNNQMIMDAVINSDQNCHGSNFNGLLEYAASRGDLEMVRFALLQGATTIKAARKAAERRGFQNVWNNPYP